MRQSSTDREPARPPILSVILGICMMVGVLFLGVGVFFFTQDEYRGATYFGLMPGLLITMGAVGVLQGKTWGENMLSVGLVLTSFCAVLVALFGYIVGQTDFAFWVSIGAVTTAIGTMTLAFLLRGTDVTSYLWALRMSRAGGSLDDALDDDVILDFGVHEEAKSVHDEPEESAKDSW